jgi:hypothetical protein
MERQTVTAPATIIKGLIGVAVVLGALLLAFGGLTVNPPWSSQAGAYLADRNFAIAALLVVLLIRRSWSILAIVLLATAAIHLLDAVADVPYHNLPGVVGSVVFTVIFAAAAAWLFRHSASLRSRSGDR